MLTFVAKCIHLLFVGIVSLDNYWHSQAELVTIYLFSNLNGIGRDEL